MTIYSSLMAQSNIFLCYRLQ